MPLGSFPSRIFTPLPKLWHLLYPYFLAPRAFVFDAYIAITMLMEGIQIVIFHHYYFLFHTVRTWIRRVLHYLRLLHRSLRNNLLCLFCFLRISHFLHSLINIHSLPQWPCQTGCFSRSHHGLCLLKAVSDNISIFLF